MSNQALPASPLGQRLWELFGSYPWAFLLKHDRGLDWQTVTRYPLKPRVFWKHWQDAAVALGVRFGHTTQYAVIDIDKGSAYLNEPKLAEIAEALETIGIYRTVPIRSSHSNGLHLYIPLPEPVKTFDFACALKNCLKAFGFEIAEGQLEIMPNTKAFGRAWQKDFVEYQGHRLPLQPGSGSVMLNHAYQPVGDSLERFFWSWDFAAKAQVLPELLEAMAFAKRHRRQHKRLQTKLEQWRDDLQHEIAEGWTDYGQTNYLLKQFATFGRVFLGLSGEELATYVADRAIGSPGYETYCRHQHHINRKALCWARSVENYYYPASGAGEERGTGETVYPLQPEPNGNKARQWDANERIRRAMYQVLSEGTYKTFVTVTQWATELVKLAHCSLTTLYRNLGAWHPQHSTVLDDFLKLCVMPHQAREAAFGLLVPGVESNPYERTPEPALNGFLTHLGGGMKGINPETTPLKNLIPEGIGGDGGKGKVSTGVSYV